MALLVAVALCAALPLSSVAAQSATDYDTDDDGLIEVANLAQLNALRWDLDGNGLPSSGNESSYAAAFPNAASGMGCPSTCTGYELVADLDFDTNEDGRTDVAGDDYWNNGAGWEPIGNSSNPFGATLHGNGRTIANLFIDRAGNAGLFGNIGSTGVVRELELPDVDVSGSGVSNLTGGLAGRNGGKVISVFVDGEVNGADLGHELGMLVGRNAGLVAASYSYGSVGGSAQYAGGLVGRIAVGAEIVASYAVATVSTTYDGIGGQHKSGLVGNNQGTVTNGYWDTDVSGITSGGGGVGKTTAELKTPTGYCYTGIYADWDDLDGDGTTDDELLWHFGTSSDYPTLSFQGQPAPDFCGAFISDQVWEVDRPEGRTLPKATGIGTLTYTLTGDLPAGMRFDADAQRQQLSGTPRETQEATAYTYTATDEDGRTAGLSFTITVKEPPELEPPSQRETPEPQLIPNRWIVGVDGTYSTSKAQGIADRNNATLHQELRWVGMIILTTNFTTQVEHDQFLTDIASDPDVTFVEQDASFQAIPSAQPTTGGDVRVGFNDPRLVPKSEPPGGHAPPVTEIGEHVVFGGQPPPPGNGGIGYGDPNR